MLRLCAVLVHRVSCLSAGLSLRLSVCHRHAVACFLTRGDLYLSWEEGAKVFDVWLLDSEWALNTCNWLWLSASAFFHTYFRCDHETLVPLVSALLPFVSTLLPFVSAAFVTFRFYAVLKNLLPRTVCTRR